MHRILVIGGTGTVGQEVLSQLAAKGVPVRALTRNPHAAQFPATVEAIYGDLTRPETLDIGLDGSDVVFLVWTAPAATAPPALERIAKHARRIVYLSAPVNTPHPLFQQPNPARSLGMEIERLIEASGLPWAFLRPGMFAANALHWWAPTIRAGDVVRWPCLSTPTAPIHERDIAGVAVHALCDEQQPRAEYVLTGPESLTQFEQLSIIGKIIGRSLHVEDLSPDQARVELARTMPLGVVEMLLSAWTAAAGQPAFVTSTVAEVTGAPARPFADWVRDHAPEFRT